MDSIVSLFYVEGNLLLTGCKIIALILSLEFTATVIYFLSRIGR